MPLHADRRFVQGPCAVLDSALALKGIRSLNFSDRSTWSAIGAVLIVCLLGLMGPIRWSLASPQRAMITDAQRYQNIARSVLEGKGFDIDHKNKGGAPIQGWIRSDGPTTFTPPVHILYLAGLFALGVSRAGIGVINAVLLTFAAVLLVFTGRRFISLPACVGGAALLLVNRPLLHYSIRHPMMTESVWVFLLIVTLFVATRTGIAPLKHGCMLGICSGVLLLTRGEAALMFPIIVLLASPSFPKVWRDPFVAIAIGVAVVIVAPWVIRNYLHTGELVVSRNGSGFSLIVNNNPNTFDTDSHAMAIAATGPPIVGYAQETNEVLADGLLASTAIDVMKSRPRVWLDSGIRRLLYLWQPINFVEGHREYWIRIVGFFFFLAGLAAIPWRQRPAWIVLAPIAIYSGMSLIVGGNMLARFRAMFAPCEAIIMACGVAACIGAIYAALRVRNETQRSFRGAAFLLAGIVAYSTVIFLAQTVDIRRTIIYAQDFERGADSIVPVSPKRHGEGTRLVAGAAENTVLSLDGSVRRRSWQGITIHIPPEMYRPNRDYKVEFDAFLPEGSLLNFVVVADLVDPTGDRVYRQWLAQSEFRWNTRWDQWTTLSAYFTTPHSTPVELNLWLRLGTTSNRTEEGYDFSGLWALVDNLRVEESSLLARYAREYFTRESDRRREFPSYKDPIFGPARVVRAYSSEEIAAAAKRLPKRAYTDRGENHSRGGA